MYVLFLIRMGVLIRILTYVHACSCVLENKNKYAHVYVYTDVSCVHTFLTGKGISLRGCKGRMRAQVGRVRRALPPKKMPANTPWYDFISCIHTHLHTSVCAGTYVFHWCVLTHQLALVYPPRHLLPLRSTYCTYCTATTRRWGH